MLKSTICFYALGWRAGHCTFRVRAFMPGVCSFYALGGGLIITRLGILRSLSWDDGPICERPARWSGLIGLCGVVKLSLRSLSRVRAGPGPELGPRARG